MKTIDILNTTTQEVLELNPQTMKAALEASVKALQDCRAALAESHASLNEARIALIDSQLMVEDIKKRAVEFLKDMMDDWNNLTAENAILRAALTDAVRENLDDNKRYKRMA